MGPIPLVPLLSNYLDQCQEEGRDLSGLAWFMDKGFVSEALEASAATRLGLHLMVSQRDYCRRNGLEPSFLQQTIDKIRKPIKAIIGVLIECFGIEHLLVKTDAGLYCRAEAKATAFTLGRYFNQAIAIEPMNIARYAV